MNIFLELQLSPWFFILGSIILLLFTLRIYRHTLPRVSQAFRRTLLGLRLLSLLLLFLILFEPILGIAIQKRQKPVVALLLDNSSSMNLHDSLSTRGERLQAILQQDFWQEASRHFELVPVVFADTARILQALAADSLDFSGDGTDLRRALDFVRAQFSDRYLDRVLLFTDGSNNLGGDPISSTDDYPVPIFAVPLGREKPEKDTWISDVISNDLAYANTRVPVEIMVRSTGYATRTAGLTLRRDGAVLLRENVQLPQDGQEKKTRIEFTPEKEGMQKYTLLLEPQNGELTENNNARTFYIKTLKSKMRIAIVAGAPSPDLAFLSRALEKNEDFAIQQFVAMSQGKMLGGRLPDDRELDRVDVIAGIDLFMNNASGKRLRSWMRNAVMRKNKPLLLLTGIPASASFLWQMRDLLLLESMPVLGRELLMLAQPTPTGVYHPILRASAEDNFDLEARFEDLPPIFSPFQRIKFLPGSRLLALAVPERRGSKPGGGSVPFLVAMRQGQRRVLAYLGTGMWRWHLMMQRQRPGDDFYENLMYRSVRWLASKEESKLLKVTTDKEIYRTAEQIFINAQAYFEDFTPREGLEINVRLTGGSLAQELLLHEKGNGLYQAKVPFLPGGDYTFRAVAEQDGREVARDTGRFTVEPFHLEYLNTLANVDLLRNIARATGGNLLKPDSLQAWLDRVEPQPRSVYQESQIPLWRQLPLLFVIITLLSAEWYLRKRKGML